MQNLIKDIEACKICVASFATTASAHRPRPVVWLSKRARILIAGQAPGLRVHQSGLPFDDASGDRLRQWLGVDRNTFYDRQKFAILPMAFCFPGYSAQGSDLPPPKICADTWRDLALAKMPQIDLTLLVGGYAQRWHLGHKTSVSACVENWRAGLPEVMPLPHPSWRNTAWLKHNPWFESTLLPELQARVAALLA